MSQLTEYTIEVYKADRRIKEGRRLVEKKEFAACTRDFIDTVVDVLRVDGYIPELFETFVTRTNLMSGKTYQERYDTPYYCSPSSESYWSM